MSSSAQLGGGVRINFEPCIDASSWTTIAFAAGGFDRKVPVIFLTNGETWTFNGYFYDSSPIGNWYSFNGPALPPLDTTKISGVAVYAYDESNMPVDMTLSGVLLMP
jgi:hypothetical protein